ncbi:hypothetical protein Cgig2_023918 [Carnegiea gigantea]|uniref:Uncharacterized protein n=1 Tax=Carnegiea gigantea TaxID=171969 RepID=A0A9Q1GHS4_9CARY|nr:hypothetical protein Cgig2_023918 [Carnegiea gigantea]
MVEQNCYEADQRDEPRDTSSKGIEGMLISQYIGAYSGRMDLRRLVLGQLLIVAIANSPRPSPTLARLAPLAHPVRPPLHVLGSPSSESTRLVQSICPPCVLNVHNACISSPFDSSPSLLPTSSINGDSDNASNRSSTINSSSDYPSPTINPIGVAEGVELLPAER